MRKNFIYILIFLFFSSINIFSQRITKDNYTGNWENSNSWNPAWTNPATSNISQNITIYGNITRNGNLSFGGSKGDLIVNDTLIIKGDLILGSNNNLTINNNGILIITGNLIIANKVDIAANSYLIVFGNFEKQGSANQGSFTSNDQPANVYIGGEINIPEGWASSNSNDVFNCNLSVEHNSTQCNYGNFIDIQEDPIIEFIENICSSKPSISQQPQDVTACINNNATFSITATNVVSYQWQIFNENAWTNLINNSTYNGVNTNTLTIYSVTQSMNGNKYRCVLRSSNNCMTISDVATLNITTEPTTGPIFHLP